MMQTKINSTNGKFIKKKIFIICAQMAKRTEHLSQIRNDFTVRLYA